MTGAAVRVCLLPESNAVRRAKANRSGRRIIAINRLILKGVLVIFKSFLQVFMSTSSWVAAVERTHPVGSIITKWA
jgi:hypothetical protein